MQLSSSTSFILFCLLASLLTVNISQAADAGFVQEALNAHNNYRAKHGAPAMTISSELNNQAQEWADYMAATNIFEHRQPNEYGENIYMSSGYTVTGATAVDSWYKEICTPYNFKNPAIFSPATGRFTQVVWKASTQLGIGMAKSRGGSTFVVANYSPAGNNVGQGNFQANVLPADPNAGNSNVCTQQPTPSGPSIGNNGNTEGTGTSSLTIDITGTISLGAVKQKLQECNVANLRGLGSKTKISGTTTTTSITITLGGTLSTENLLTIKTCLNTKLG